MIEMNLETAERAARAAIAKANAMGVKTTVSVVDEAGRLVLTLRGDGTGFLTPESSRAKAVAAANYRMSTMDIAAMHGSNPFWAGVPAITRGEALPTGGAAPILRGGKLIGAIGCGGGSAKEDQEVADAGAAAIS
jgi:uncharacterized protein GlcG (DUF336 family)